MTNYGFGAILVELLITQLETRSCFNDGARCIGNLPRAPGVGNQEFVYRSCARRKWRCPRAVGKKDQLAKAGKRCHQFVLDSRVLRILEEFVGCCAVCTRQNFYPSV